MDEFGETLTIYVWPAGHEEGQPYREGFYQQLHDALSAAGIEWEMV